MSFEVSKSQLVEIILALDISVGTMERQLADLKKKRQDAERQLIDMMEADEEKGFIDENGRKIARDDKMYVTVRNDQKQDWFAWVEDIGRPDLIKTDINKNSLNAIIKKIIKGEMDFPLPEVFDMQRDLYFVPRVSIKLGSKSLRKAAEEAEER